jgi:hypothetical protein
VLWALTDLAVTGNPLWSLQGTSELAAELERPTGLFVLPAVVPFRLGEILRLSELVAAVMGFAAGLVWFRRRTLLPLAVAVVNGVAIALFALAGLPLLGRYLFLGAAMLALFAALAALGWSALAPETARGTRRAWATGGTLVLAAIVAFAPAQLGRLADLRADIAARDRVQDDVYALVAGADEPSAGLSPAAAALSRCGPLYVPNHRNVPNLSLWTGLRPGAIRSAQLERPSPRGLFLAPASPRVAELSILDPNDPRRLAAEAPATYREIDRNDSWILYGDCSP